MRTKTTIAIVPVPAPAPALVVGAPVLVIAPTPVAVTPVAPAPVVAPAPDQQNTYGTMMNVMRGIKARAKCHPQEEEDLTSCCTCTMMVTPVLVSSS